MYYDVVIVGAGPAGIATALKIAEKNYRILIIDKKDGESKKPCGGILTPACSYIIKNDLGLSIPKYVFALPENIGLFLIPPSGKGGPVRNYKLSNINRNRFDKWLLSTVEKHDLTVSLNTKFLDLVSKSYDEIIVKIKNDNKLSVLKTKYLVGADGVFSKVRSLLYPALKMDKIVILQEYWVGRGDFEEYFYMFLLNRDITPIYGYIIPKNNLLILGIGAYYRELRKIESYMIKFKNYLIMKHNLKPAVLKKKEIGFIPRGSIVEGKDNIILVGDAGGFCNPFTGEGIRFAIETGVAAASSIIQADKLGLPLAQLYMKKVEELKEFILKSYMFELKLDNDAREEFVNLELSRNTEARWEMNI